MIQVFTVYRPVMVNRNSIIVHYLGEFYASKAAVVDNLKSRYGSSKYVINYSVAKVMQVSDELGTYSSAEIMYALSPSGSRIGFISVPVFYK